MFRVNREHIIFSYSESHTCTNKSLSCAKPCRLYHILNYVKRCKLFKSFLFFVMFDMWMIYLMIYWQNIRHQIKYLTHHVSIISNIIYISEHDHRISLYLSICVNAWKSVDAILQNVQSLWYTNGTCYRHHTHLISYIWLCYGSDLPIYCL